MRLGTFVIGIDARKPEVRVIPDLVDEEGIAGIGIRVIGITRIETTKLDAARRDREQHQKQ